MATNPVLTTASTEEEASTIHPIPSSIIIVNESTPLISQDQQLAGGVLHVDTKFHLSSCFALSTDEERRENELKGLLLLILSSFLFTIVSVIVKLLAPPFSSFEIVFARTSIQFPLGLLGCCLLRVNPFGKKGVRRWIFIRALTSSIALCLFFYSLTKLTLIEATVIFFMGPIFKVMIASILLNESFNVVEGFYSIVCFVGLLLIAKPGFGGFSSILNEDYERSFAIACALAASLMSALAYLTVRKVGQGTHIMVHVVYFGIVASLLSLPMLLLRLQEFIMPQKNWHELGLLLMIGLIAFVGQFFLNRGLKMAPTGPVTLARTTDVVFAFLFGMIIFKEIPGFYTLLGSSLVVGTTTLMSMYRWHLQELKTAAIRRRKSKDKLARQLQQQQQQQQEQ